MNYNIYDQQQPMQALPFSCEQLQQPMINIGQQTPLPVPVVQAPPEFAGYLPLIAMAVADELQRKAQTNPVRVFAFNRFGQNYFNNQEFLNLVATTADVIVMMAYVRRAYTSLEFAIQDQVPKMVELAVATQAFSFPVLAQVAARMGGDQMVSNLRMAADELVRLGSEIQQLKNSGQWPMAQPTMQQQGIVQAYGPRGPMQGFANQPMQQPAHRSAVLQGNTGLFQGQSNAAQPLMRDPGTGRTIQVKDRWSNAPQATQQPTQQEVLQQPFTRSEPQMQNQLIDVPGPQAGEVIPYKKGLYKPTHGSQAWYLPAYNPYRHQLMLRRDSENILSPFIEQRTEVLDYERHKLPTVFGTPPAELKLSPMGTALEQLNKAALELIEQNNDEERHVTYKPTVFVKDTWLAETSYPLAWLVASMERFTKNHGEGKADIFRAYAQVADPVISMKDETDVVAAFGASNTFIELREKMNAMVNDVSAELWTLSERRMTEVINRILRQNLSIPQLAIQSFVTDLDELLEYLVTKYDESIKTAFLKHQKSVIRAEFGTLTEEVAQGLTDVLIDSREYEAGQQPKITYVVANTSMTYLNCRSYELELELFEDQSALVTPNYTPVMFTVLEQLFKEADTFSHPFAHHYLRTNDGRIMEATRGFISDDAYLLTLIK